MPPKSKNADPNKILLGRPGNNLKMGLVGLPNVGKSTFFNALTNSSVPAENYPFCTIDPSESRVAVPDSRFDWLCETYKPASKIPAALTVYDIAGLVKGASTGEGLGNAFLSHIRAVDGIFHMSRAFADPDVVHVEGDVDPVRDLSIIASELRAKDLEFLTKHLTGVEAAFKRLGKSGETKDKRVELETLQKLVKLIGADGKDVRHGEWNNDEIRVINELTLLSAKPVVYLVNLSEADFVKKKNKWLSKIKAWVDGNYPEKPDVIIPICASLELAVSTAEDPKAYLEGVSPGLTSMLSKVITNGYSALDLQYFFTAGPDEVRAWTIRKQTKAPSAAGTIHTDFEKAFIMAEVMKFEDLKEAGTEVAVKAAGKYVQKGKDYIVNDGDVCYFKVGQITAPKKK